MASNGGMDLYVYSMRDIATENCITKPVFSRVYNSPVLHDVIDLFNVGLFPRLSIRQPSKCMVMGYLGFGRNNRFAGFGHRCFFFENTTLSGSLLERSFSRQTIHCISSRKVDCREINS